MGYKKSLSNYIKEHALAWYVSFEDEKTIDDINILQATQKSFASSILECRKQYKQEQQQNVEKEEYSFYLLIDGNYFKTVSVLNNKTNNPENEVDDDYYTESDDTEETDDEYEENKPALVFGKELIQPVKSNQNNLVNNELEELEFNLQELEKMQESEESEELKEFNIEENQNKSITLETMKLKKPNQVYYELYNEAKKKAKEYKQQAILAFLEAKNIKKTYMLDNLDDSDEDEEEPFSR